MYYCVCVVCSVAVSCDPICSRNTEFIVCLLWSFSTSSKRASHPLHTIPYIVLYLRASYTSKRTVYHFSRKKGCSLKIVFLQGFMWTDMLNCNHERAADFFPTALLKFPNFCMYCNSKMYHEDLVDCSLILT